MKKESKNKIIGAFLGTIVEYYDYSLYGFSAGIIAAKFFPNADYVTNLINAYAVYAFAYLSKPIGSLVFGYIGDLYGRKTALSITIIGIVIPTTIIGLLPEYSSIGVWSTVILVLCRFVQGVFVAGEYDGAAIYVIEHLSEKYRATASAITRCTGALGLLLGIGATNLFTAHVFPDWCWRIPFLLSLPLAMVALYFRRKFSETPDFMEYKEKAIRNTSFKVLIKKQWQVIIMVILLAGGFGVTYQISIIFMKQYLPIVLPQTSFIISTFSVLIIVCFAFTMPIAGLLADRYGELKILRVSLLMTIVASVLFITAVNYQMVNLALVSCLMLASFVSPFNALAHGIAIKAFSVNERYRAIGLGHTTGSVLMSGSANYVCLVLMRYFNFPLFPIIYVILFAILAYLVIGPLLSHHSRQQELSINKEFLQNNL